MFTPCHSSTALLCADISPAMYIKWDHLIIPDIFYICWHIWSLVSDNVIAYFIVRIFYCIPSKIIWLWRVDEMFTKAEIINQIYPAVCRLGSWFKYRLAFDWFLVIQRSPSNRLEASQARNPKDLLSRGVHGMLTDIGKFTYNKL